MRSIAEPWFSFFTGQEARSHFPSRERASLSLVLLIRSMREPA